MPRIRILPDQLVSQIAAGEVVERPASVVKELVENALDAGAAEVRVTLAAGGKGLVRVADDGQGMGRDDALLAFDRHATSKIAAFADLDRLATLGFRGEALAAIAAVGRVELRTAERPGEGTRVRLEGGRVLTAEPVAHPRGTTVEISSLFFNVPARRRFLKATSTELRRALEVVQGYALARPEARFLVEHEGRVLLDAPALGLGGEGASDPASARERLAQLFGGELGRGLVELQAAPAAGERVRGFLGGRDTVRGRRQFVFVNRRLVRDRAVLGVFYRAVREEWREDEAPALFLFLELPPEAVDVNVHPQKAEVRFRDPAFLGRLEEVLRRALGRARGEEPAPLRPAALPADYSLAWQGLGGRSTAAPAGEVREPGGPPGVAGGASAGRLAEAVYAPLARAPVPLSGRSSGARPFRLLGQYKGTLVLLEGPDGLYVIDQHVAHERVLYERLRRQLEAGSAQSQALLEPRLLQLGAAERLRLLELEPQLERAGFRLAALSGDTLGLAAVPAALAAADAEGLLVALAGAEDAGTTDDAGDGLRLRARLLDALAAGMACKAAVKMHHPLSAAEMEALVGELFAAEQPYSCPHGRPIVLQMTDADLEHRFGRR